MEATPIGRDASRSGFHLRWLSCLVLAVALIPLHLELQRYAFDDAYIHVRIAQHLAEHGLPYFNLDEPINGSSSATWTWLLALWFALIGDRPVTLGLLNALITALGASIWAWLLVPAERGPRHGVRWLATLGAYTALVLPSSVGCMESPLALALLGLGVLLHVRRQAVAFLALTLATLTRPELIVILGPFLLHALLIARLPWRRVAAWSAVAALPYAIYGLGYFGSLLPHTAHAKQLVFSLTLRDATDTLIRAVAPWPAAGPLGSLEARVGWLVVVGLVLLLALVRQWPELREQRPNVHAAMLVLGGGAIAATYLVQRVFLHPWYLPLFTVPLLFGTAMLLGAVRLRLAATGCVLALGPFVLQAALTVWAAIADPTAHAHFTSGARVRRYLEVGRSLRQVAPGGSLLTSEIGGLGYGYRGRLHDGVGLISPAALRHHPLRVPAERSRGDIGAIPPDFVSEVLPELIVSHPIFIQSLLRHPVLANYRAYRVPIFLQEDIDLGGATELWGSSALLVFVRNDADPQRLDALNWPPVACGVESGFFPCLEGPWPRSRAERISNR